MEATCWIRVFHFPFSSRITQETNSANIKASCCFAFPWLACVCDIFLFKNASLLKQKRVRLKKKKDSQRSWTLTSPRPDLSILNILTWGGHLCYLMASVLFGMTCLRTRKVENLSLNSSKYNHLTCVQFFVSNAMTLSGNTFVYSLLFQRTRTALPLCLFLFFIQRANAVQTKKNGCFSNKFIQHLQTDSWHVVCH